MKQGDRRTDELLNQVITVEQQAICPDLPAAAELQRGVRLLNSSHLVRRDAGFIETAA